MPTLHLRVDPVFVGPASEGTIELIRLLQARLALPLAATKALVDRCVFDEESVAIPIASVLRAEQLAEEVRALVSPARMQVRVEL